MQAYLAGKLVAGHDQEFLFDQLAWFWQEHLNHGKALDFDRDFEALGDV